MSRCPGKVTAHGRLAAGNTLKRLIFVTIDSCDWLDDALSD